MIQTNNAFCFRDLPALGHHSDVLFRVCNVRGAGEEDSVWNSPRQYRLDEAAVQDGE